MLALALILGLSLGLTLGRSESSPASSSASTIPLTLASSKPFYPSPRGGSTASWSASYAKAAELVSGMSLLAKVNVTTGTGWRMGPCVGNTGSAPGVGWPGLCLQDGPLGVRFADGITVFPAGITVAATWSRALMLGRGKALGREMRAKGVGVMLGPAVFGGRFPAGGRNWEGFGGDPWLSGVAVGETVRGVQSTGVVACVKHWVANEQELFRQGIEARGQGWKVDEALSANVDGRALREVYAWPYMDAVKEGVGAVMCSYNQINNSYGCQNSYLLNGVLKDEFGFQGFIVSDWIAQRSGVASVLAGLDMTMPGDGDFFANGASFLGPQLTLAVLNGSIPLWRLDDMVLRITAAWYQMGQDSTSFPRPNFSSWFRSESGPVYVGSDEEGQKQSTVQNEYVDAREEHHELARQISAEGVVLLKNELGTLPLGRGKSARKQLVIIGSGAEVNPEGANACGDRSCNRGTLGQGWGSGTAEYSFFSSPLTAVSSRAYKDRTMLTTVLSDDPTSPQLLAAAEQNSNQTCIVFVSADSGEGYQIVESQRGDRNDLNLWHHGDEVIIAVAARCKDTIVVIHTVGPVVMERWIEHPNVTAVLMAGLPGQEAGESLADILYGDVNPSGRLPYTIGKSLQDYGANSQIMYTPNAAIPQQDLFDADDGLLADYRYFDRYNITPRFEFGFGLGYADFVFADVEVKVVDQGGVREFPPARGNDEASPPVLNSSLPQDRAEVLFPSGWKKIKGFVYPYLDSLPASSTAPAPVATVTASPRSPVAFSALFDVILHVTATVRNTHPTLPGKAVAQLYLRFPETKGVRFPMQVLRGFEKVGVGAGETIRVGFDLTRRDLSYWDEGVGNWRLPVDGEGRWGGYGVRVGASSRGEGWVNVGRWVVGG